MIAYIVEKEIAFLSWLIDAVRQFNAEVTGLGRNRNNDD